MSARIDHRAWFIAIALVWLCAWLHLAGEWMADEQYRYGFGVPVLFCWMAWRRRCGDAAPGRRTAAWWALTGLGIFAFLLGQLLRWHDPLWRLTGAVIAGAAVLLTGAWIQRLGGAVLFRREIFPLAFSMLAVPWPVPLELRISQGLAGFVTDSATTIVNAFGVAALQRGNVIELANGSVGVDEACSGIQSLQSALMVSLFLGEYFQMRSIRRAALVVAGCGFAVFGNFIRIFALTMITHSGGRAAAAAWHDAVGLAATVAIFTGLLVVARKSSGSPVLAFAKAPPPFEVSAGAEGRCMLVIVSAILFGSWLMASAAGGRDSVPRWSLTDSRLPSGWSAESVAPTPAAKSLLRFSEWKCLQVRTDTGASAQVIRLAWRNGVRTPAFVTTHTPAVCLPAAGWKQSEPPFYQGMQIRGAELHCTVFPFERDGVRIIAFQHLLAGGRPAARIMDPSEIPGTFARLATLWREPMRQITEEVLLYIADPGDAGARKAAATQIFEAVLSVRIP